MVCLLLLPAISLAKSNNPEPFARTTASGSLVVWTTAVNHETVSLTVVAPDGSMFRKEFAAGTAPSFRLQDLGGKVSDGSYTYEMRFVPRISPAVKQQLAAAREAGDDAAAAKIQRDAGITTEMVQSGSLAVLNGAFVNPDMEEPPQSVLRLPASGTTTASINAPRTIKPLDIVQPDDVIIQGSLCVGLDCVVNESFGFDTIRMKENNTRIKFDDTSTSAGFPNHDWQLTANDSGSGGANKFSIEDITASTVPFTVTGSAPTNSIFVDSTGRVGFRTSTPNLDLHINTSNTPAHRFEQNSSGGFTAQTWDVAGNEANFFVRDVTGGSRLPFRIRPGAPTSSIDIAATGFVGIGTASPSSNLHVSTDNNEAMRLSRSNGGFSYIATYRATTRQGLFGDLSDGWGLWTDGAIPLLFKTNGGFERMRIDSGGTVTVTGNLTVTGTKNFAMVDPGDSKKAIYYAALEGPEAGTYFRGSAKTVNGEAVIELPGYFSRVTECERMTVQLTAVGGWSQVYVAEKTPQRLVIKVANNSPDLNFDYLVQGVRKGYLDYETERDNNLPKN
jgi:hypothetical protein